MDVRAFEELTARYYRPVGAFVYRRVGRADRVEDLVQETFLEAFRALREGKQPGAVERWLFGIAHNVCGKFLQRKRPALFAPAEPPVDLVARPEDTLEEREEAAEVLARLADGLADLPDETRRLLEMKHRHGKTMDEIARATGKPAGTVKSTLARTYKLLRERLRPGGGSAA